MSTDLKLLPVPAAPPNDVVSSIPSDPVDDCNNSINESRDHYQCPSTPTAAKHRIPALSSPPPAPRKRRHVTDTVPPCKRRLRFDFFDNDKELQEFFASSFAQIQAQRILKRRCLCTWSSSWLSIDWLINPLDDHITSLIIIIVVLMQLL